MSNKRFCGILPALVTPIRDDGSIREEAAAQAQQFKINRAIEIILRHGLFPALKHMLTLQGFEVGEPVFPTKRFAPEEAQALIKDLNAIRFFEDYQ